MVALLTPFPKLGSRERRVRVWGLGFRVWGLGFIGVKGLERVAKGFYYGV